MKIITAENGKRSLKISKTEWSRIGEKFAAKMGGRLVFRDTIRFVEPLDDDEALNLSESPDRVEALKTTLIQDTKREIMSAIAAQKRNPEFHYQVVLNFAEPPKIAPGGLFGKMDVKVYETGSVQDPEIGDAVMKAQIFS